MPKLKSNDLVISFIRSRGKGGQNVNKVSSAVRVRHLPSGLTIKADSERSQRANRALALARLEHRLAAAANQQKQQHQAELAAARARKRRRTAAEKAKLKASKQRHAEKKRQRRYRPD